MLYVIPNDNTNFFFPFFSFSHSYKFNEKRNMANVQSDHVPSAAVGAFRNFTATKAKGKKKNCYYI